MSAPRRRPRHDQYFLEGYTFHQAVELHPTFDGESNLYGFTEEILMDKIELSKRMCCKVAILISDVNDQLYDIQNERHAGLAWYLMKAVFGICMKLSRKYTEYIPSVQDACEITDTLECVKEIKVMLEHLKFCSLYNPRENITAASLDLWCRLLQKCGQSMEKHLYFIECSRKENTPAKSEN